MSVIDSHRVFTGKKSLPAVVEELREAGFVHVTGISTLCSRDSDGYLIGSRLNPQDFGKWDHNNGTVVLVTEGGEVWLAADSGGSAGRALEEMAKRHAPKGQGAYVPLSNGERVSAHDLLRRVASPYFGLAMPIADDD
jgi:hypothetical protein